MGLGEEADLVSDEESGTVSPHSCGREIVIGEKVRFCLKYPHEEWEDHESIYNGCAISWGGWTHAEIDAYSSDEDGT
jgi:hypothetical protein